MAVWCGRGGGGLRLLTPECLFILCLDNIGQRNVFLLCVQCQGVDKLISFVIVDDGCRIQ